MADENQQRIQAARTLVAAPLLVTLADNLDEKGQRESATKVRESIQQDWRTVGEITISDAVLHPYVYHLRLSKVPAHYYFDAPVPTGYEGAMRAQFTIFREAIRAFWHEWRARMVTSGFRDRMLETETAFYWDNDDKYWVGIIGYVTDNDGKRYK